MSNSIIDAIRADYSAGMSVAEIASKYFPHYTTTAPEAAISTLLSSIRWVETNSKKTDLKIVDCQGDCA
jgi:hypothetical protein